MSGTSMVGRVELRRHRGAVVGLVVIVAAVVAVVLSLAAGARRTSTVLDRFVAATGARDLTVFRSSGAAALDPSSLDPWVERIRSVDGVEAVGLQRGLFVDAGTDVDFTVLASPDGSSGVGIDRLLMVDGRLPEEDSVGEVALNESAARALGLGVGDRFTVAGFPPEDIAGLFAGSVDFADLTRVPLQLRVVGVGRSGEELSGRATQGSPAAVASPAFYRAHEADLGWSVTILGLRTDGALTEADLEEAVGSGASMGEEVQVSSTTSEWRGEAAEGFDIVAAALWVFTGVAALVGLLGVAQAVVRQAGLSVDTERVLAGLGLGHRARVAAVSIPAAVAVTVGVVVGAATSVGLSGLFPVSIARRGEPRPGLRFDPLVVVGGGAAVAALLLVVVGVGTALVLRDRTPRRGESGVSGRLAGRIARPVPSIGVRMAFDGRAGRRSVPIRSALVGAMVGTAGVMAVVVFTGSAGEAVASPDRFGWVWTAKPDVMAIDDPVAMFAEIVAGDEIEAAGDVRCALVGVEDVTRYACSLVPAKGAMALAVTDGSPPAGPGDVALGATLMDQLDVEAGDDVNLRGIDGTSHRVRVTGRAVGPMYQSRNPGDGLHVTPALLDELAPPDVVGEFSNRFVGLRYRPGLDPNLYEADLVQRYPLDFNVYSRPDPPSLLQLLEQMRWLFAALAAFLGTVGVVGLTHYLMISVRRRRPELGVIRALGLRRFEVAGAVSWQAASAALVGVVVGIPSGVALGRMVWRLAVADLGIVVVPAAPWAAVILVAVAAVGGAAVLGFGPGWYAGRRRPADTLRAE